MFTEASDECRAFAETLPRRRLLHRSGGTGHHTATSLTIVSPFLLLPHVLVSWHALLAVVRADLHTRAYLRSGTAVDIIFLSVRCKQALFKTDPGNPDKPVTESIANVKRDWDVYELERAAFTAVAVPQPSEWETRQPIRWLIGAIYFAAIAILPATSSPWPTLIILGLGSVAVRWPEDLPLAAFVKAVGQLVDLEFRLCPFGVSTRFRPSAWPQTATGPRSSTCSVSSSGNARRSSGREKTSHRRTLLSRSIQLVSFSRFPFPESRLICGVPTFRHRFVGIAEESGATRASQRPRGQASSGCSDIARPGRSSGIISRGQADHVCGIQVPSAVRRDGAAGESACRPGLVPGDG